MKPQIIILIISSTLRSVVVINQWYTISILYFITFPLLAWTCRAHRKPVRGSPHCGTSSNYMCILYCQVIGSMRAFWFLRIPQLDRNVWEFNIAMINWPNAYRIELTSRVRRLTLRSTILCVVTHMISIDFYCDLTTFMNVCVRDFYIAWCTHWI